MEFPVWLNGTLRSLTEYHFNGEGFSDSEAAQFAQAWSRSRQPGVTFLAPQGLRVGAFRQHYLYSGLSGLPLSEKVTIGASVLAGLGGLSLVSTHLSWDVMPSLGVTLGYDHFGRWRGDPDRSELLFLPYRNRVNASVTAWY